MEGNYHLPLFIYFLSKFNNRISNNTLGLLTIFVSNIPSLKQKVFQSSEYCVNYSAAKMSIIQTDRVLPPQLCIESIDDILYSIGLCHHSVREIPKRSVINNPLLIALVLIIQILMRIVSNNSENKIILLLTAEVYHFINLKQFLNPVISLLSLIVFLTQLVYYYNHSIGVKSTFVRVFQVLSGSITPSCVGLNNPTQVKQLLSIAKWLPLLKKNNEIVVPFIALWFIFLLHFLSLDLISSLILFIYPAMFYCIWSYYIFNLLTIQIILFYILCKYFLIKLKELNRLLKEEKRMNTNRIRFILRSFDALYREIDEYNSTYWSKFLLIIWFLFGIIIILMIYIIIFSEIRMEIKIIIFYILFLYINMYLLILSIASSVNSEANKSYKLFNSLYIKFRKTTKLDKRRLTTNQMKVNLIIHNNKNSKIISIYFRSTQLLKDCRKGTKGLPVGYYLPSITTNASR